MTPSPKVALVVDALPSMGGAEKVLLAALELFPQAPVYTLVYNASAFAGSPLARRQVFSSFLQRLPLARSQYRVLLPFMPPAIERFDLSAYELVLSFSYAVAHGVRTSPGQTHLTYTHTPMRYAWRNFGLDGGQHPNRKLTHWLFQPFRRWDVAAASRVGRFAAVSRWIVHWVQQAYQRQAQVIYPPVEVDRFTPHMERGDYYVSVSRLVAHKRHDLLVDAFNRLGLPLLVIGEGPQRARLERKSRPNIRFLGFQPDEALAGILNRARGFICPGEEDFGIAMVEAQAAGCPVIAYRRGGALETVVEGQTGLFFDQPDSQSLVEAVLCCEQQHAAFDPRPIATHASRFNKGRFLEEFAAFVGHYDYQT